MISDEHILFIMIAASLITLMMILDDSIESVDKKQEPVTCQPNP